MRDAWSGATQSRFWGSMPALGANAKFCTKMVIICADAIPADSPCPIMLREFAARPVETVAFSRDTPGGMDPAIIAMRLRWLKGAHPLFIFRRFEWQRPPQKC
jgi:hypothetical protein